MSEQPSSDDVVTIGGLGGRDLGGRPAGRSRRIAIAAAVAAVAMVGGAGVAYAASSAGSGGSAAAKPASSVSHTAAPCPASAACAKWHGIRRFPKGFVVPGPGMVAPMIGLGPLGAVHGQFVVAKPGGGYQTVDMQRGKVTAVSTSSITVRSPDGFSASYAVTGSTVVDAQRDGIGSVKTGDQVTIEAKVSGSTATAANIVDLTRVASGHKAFGFGWSSASGTG